MATSVEEASERERECRGTARVLKNDYKLDAKDVEAERRREERERQKWGGKEQGAGATKARADSALEVAASVKAVALRIMRVPRYHGSSH